MNYTISCPPRIRIKKNFTCIDSGFIDYLQCNGTAGSFDGVCPVLKPSCSALNTVGQSIATNGGQCLTVNTTSAGITCRCGLGGLGDTGVVAAGLIMKYVGSDLTSPFKSAASLNSAAAVGKAIIIVVLYSSLWGSVAVLVIYFSCVWIRCTPKATESNESAAEAVSAKQQFIDYVSTIFPAVFDDKSVLLLLKSEFVLHHLYLNFLVRVRYNNSPALALLKMITVQSYLLFLLALLYDFNYPSDDGSCVRFATQASCLKRRYVLDNEHSYCQWHSSDGSGAFSCSYSEPNFSFTIGMYVSIMISVGTCLTMEPLEYLISLLAAPIGNSSRAAVGPAVGSVSDAAEIEIRSKSTLVRQASTVRRHRPSMAVSTVPSSRHSFAIKVQPLLEQYANVTLSEDLFSQLKADLLLQRSLLNGEQLQQFDDLWGLDTATGGFLFRERQRLCFQTQTLSVADVVESELRDVGRLAEGILEELSSASDAERGVEILLCFVKDLMGRHSAAGRIFASKSDLDCEKEMTVSLLTKVAVALFIFSINAFFIYYTILKGYDKGLAWQFDYVKAWLVQLSLDVFVFETIQCAWIHVTVPCMVSEEVRRVRALLQDAVERVYLDRHEPDDLLHSLNAPDYLFVANRLAASYPELVESKLVQTYSNYLPGEAGNVWTTKLQQYEVNRQSIYCYLPKVSLVFLLVQLAATTSMHTQCIIIRVLEPLILSTLTFGCVLLLHKPVFLAVFCIVLVCLVAMAIRDYFRSSAVISVNSLPGDAAAIAAGDQPAMIIPVDVENNHPSLPIEYASSDGLSADDDILFNRLFSDFSVSDDDTLPRCLRDSSESSSSAEDSDHALNIIFGGGSNYSDNSSSAGSVDDIADPMADFV